MLLFLLLSSYKKTQFRISCLWSKELFLACSRWIPQLQYVNFVVRFGRDFSKPFERMSLVRAQTAPGIHWVTLSWTDWLQRDQSHSSIPIQEALTSLTILEQIREFRRWTNTGLMLGRHRRRWTNIKPALCQCVCWETLWLKKLQQNIACPLSSIVFVSCVLTHDSKSLLHNLSLVGFGSP